MNNFETGFYSELEKIAKKFKEEERFVRRAGPGMGALVGGTIGAVKGSKGDKKKLPLAMLTGVGTGATIGWLPDIGMSAAEAAKRYKKKKLDQKEKTSAAMPGIPKAKGMEQLSKGLGAGGGATKGFASAMRSPLSLVTAMKPPKQEFFKGV